MMIARTVYRKACTCSCTLQMGRDLLRQIANHNDIVRHNAAQGYVRTYEVCTRTSKSCLGVPASARQRDQGKRQRSGHE